MEYPHKTDTLIHLMRNLKAVVSKCREQNRYNWILNHKPGLDHNLSAPHKHRQLTRSFSDISFVRNCALKENFEKHLISNGTSDKISELGDSNVELNGQCKHQDNSSDRFSNKTYSATQLRKPPKSFPEMNQFNQKFGEANESFRMKTNQQDGKLQYLSFDSDCSLRKGSSKTRSSNPSGFISEKDRLTELIKVAGEENFALRKSNVKFLHHRKLQNLKIRDLKHKISLQSQKLVQQRAEERTRWGLENIIRDKQLEIQSLKHQIKAVKEQLQGEISIVTEVESRPKRKTVNNITEVGRLRTQKSPRRDRGDFNVHSLGSKLNYLLVKLSKDAESCSAQLKFLEQNVGFLRRSDRL